MPERSILELREMDEAEAKDTLTVNEYGRWQKLKELEEGAKETEERWQEQDELVQEITVHADPDQLGTDVDLYGNDVLVHIDSEDPQLRAAIDTLESEFGEIDDDEVPELTEERRDRYGSALIDALDAVILRWNGHDWDSLDRPRREAILSEARDKWGLEATVMA